MGLTKQLKTILIKPIKVLFLLNNLPLSMTTLT